MTRPRLYLITDRRATRGRDLADVVERALDAVPMGAAMVQVREKDLPTRALIDLVQRLLPITRARACPLLVNDRLDIALAAGADGVHLPERGLDIAAVRRVAPACLLGASTHSPQTARAAALAGADIVVCGPIWPTPSKQAYGACLGVDALAAAARACAGRAAVYAIGGITDPDRARAAIRHGAHGVAGIRAFLSADDPGEAARAMYSAVSGQPDLPI